MCRRGRRERGAGAVTPGSPGLGSALTSARRTPEDMRDPACVWKHSGQRTRFERKPGDKRVTILTILGECNMKVLGGARSWALSSSQWVAMGGFITEGTCSLSRCHCYV